MSCNSLSVTSTPLVIAMVGLPARGKSYISKKLTRYLNWLGIGTKIFNAGDYRRQVTDVHESGSADFYDPDNEQGKAVREQCAQLALDDLCNWLKKGMGQVAIFDATNTTKARRAMLHETVVNQQNLKLLFIESICNDQEQIIRNIIEAKTKNADYSDGHLSIEQIIEDFNRRIANYVKVYQELDPLDEHNLSFIKIIDGWEKVETNKIVGSLKERAVQFLKCTHITKGSIFMGSTGDEEAISRRFSGKQDLQIFASKDKIASFINAQVTVVPSLVASSNESHQDLTNRLDQLILVLEQHENDVLILADLPAMQCLLKYFTQVVLELVPGSIFKLSPETYGYSLEEIPLSQSS